MSLSYKNSVIKGRGFNPDGGGFTEILINGKVYSGDMVAEAVHFYESSASSLTSTATSQQEAVTIERLTQVTDRLALSLQKLINYVHHTNSSTENAVTQIREVLQELVQKTKGPEFDDFMTEIRDLESYSTTSTQEAGDFDISVEQEVVETPAMEDTAINDGANSDRAFKAFNDLQTVLMEESKEFPELITDQDMEEVPDLPTLEAMLQAELDIDGVFNQSYQEQPVSSDTASEIVYDFLSQDEQNILAMMTSEQQQLWHDYVASEREHFQSRYGIQPEALTQWLPRKNFIDWSSDVFQ